ncbi:hypothetical protein BKA56DRAFT_661204 [Ilyonectria sp. MPI-CAGE-AT-0026]|nr:hypothetical protein BKA56DRAFT_661204 [Ilyonectria sp. MPI-CAGE-AT-0026]
MLGIHALPLRVLSPHGPMTNKHEAVTLDSSLPLQVGHFSSIQSLRNSVWLLIVENTPVIFTPSRLFRTSHSLTSSSYRRSPYAALMSASSAVAPKGPWMHPSPHLTHLDAFRRCINRKYGLNLTNYTQLHKWSVDEIESFCREIWTFCGLVYTKPPSAVAVGIESMWPRPRWFPGARLNYTENVLIKGLAAHPDAVAVSACREGGTRWRHLTWMDLRGQVALYTSALRYAGVKQGDRVASKLGNGRHMIPWRQIRSNRSSFYLRPAPSGPSSRPRLQDGRNIENSGQKGDLVITKPFFSMPVTFWGEGGHEKYRKAYFDVFPGTWCHGDSISKDLETQSYVIHGRSDGVLNPGGVRFGTADLYNVISKFSQVEDCIAVGQRRPKDNDERVLLFLKMSDNARPEDSLRADIAKAIRKDLSGRHVPAYMFQVRDIPYTSNGKKIENLVRDIVCRETVRVGGTATNPECLKEYEQYLHLPLLEEKAKL